MLRNRNIGSARQRRIPVLAAGALVSFTFHGFALAQEQPRRDVQAPGGAPALASSSPGTHSWLLDPSPIGSVNPRPFESTARSAPESGDEPEPDARVRARTEAGSAETRADRTRVHGRGGSARRTGPAAASGIAAWYEHPGRTASGEVYNPDGLTAAHRTLPFGTRMRVVNPKNGRSVVVRVNDRAAGPRKIAVDLSRGAARRLGIEGIAPVRMSVLSSP